MTSPIYDVVPPRAIISVAVGKLGTSDDALNKIEGWTAPSVLSR